MDSKKSLAWWIVAVVAVLIILAFAAYYFRYQAAPGVDTESVSAINDAVPVVEQELGSLNLEGLDSELSDIDKELAQ